MPLEIATLVAKEGMDDDLAAAFQSVIDVVLRYPGASSAQVYRQQEDPRVFTLTIDWKSVEEHEAFLSSDLIPEFRAAFGRRVESTSPAHYDLIAHAE